MGMGEVRSALDDSTSELEKSPKYENKLLSLTILSKFFPQNVANKVSVEKGLET